MSMVGVSGDCYTAIMNICVRRVYEDAAKADGKRVLVDRLWPRGITKKAAHVDLWAKELAPSNELRAWYHADKEGRFRDFCKKYRTELVAQKTSAKHLLKGTKKLTLVTAVRDVEHSHIPVLERFLRKMGTVTIKFENS